MLGAAREPFFLELPGAVSGIIFSVKDAALFYCKAPSVLAEGKLSVSMGAEKEKSEVLVVNIGSATFKWSAFVSMTDEEPVSEGKMDLAHIAGELNELIVLTQPACCIVRFVHGGNDFSGPVVVTKRVLRQLEQLVELAPLHNLPALNCIEHLLELKSNPKVIAVFDTALFHDLPEEAQAYGLPLSLVSKYQIRRFGFHGFAHAAMLASLDEFIVTYSSIPSPRRVVTLQLGSGCSSAAFLDRQPIDNSMGFTPNEGLLMSTRCGDIDAGLVTWLQQQEGWGPQQVNEVLNQQSGWKGLSGISDNFEELIASKSIHASLAIKLFIRRIKKSIGASNALLGGLDAVVLSGGIAENAIPFCVQLLANLEHLGIKLLPMEIVVPAEKSARYTILSDQDSPVHCLVVPQRESKAMLATVLSSDIGEEFTKECQTGARN